MYQKGTLELEFNENHLYIFLMIMIIFIIGQSKETREKSLLTSRSTIWT